MVIVVRLLHNYNNHHVVRSGEWRRNYNNHHVLGLALVQRQLRFFPPRSFVSPNLANVQTCPPKFFDFDCSSCSFIVFLILSIDIHSI
jgi:hypothetical protein